MAEMSESVVVEFSKCALSSFCYINVD